MVETEQKIEKGTSLNTVKNQGEVGYCRPPKEYQYKPGQSGNTKGKPEGAISPINKVKQIFKKNPKAFKGFIEGYIKDPRNRQHIVEMIDGKPKSALDLTTGGQSFFYKPNPEEREKINKRFMEIE